MNRSHYRKPIVKLVEYGGVGNPLIVAVFIQDKGWIAQRGMRKLATESRLRKFQKAGGTHVSVHFDCEGKRAPVDFSIAELLAK